MPSITEYKRWARQHPNFMTPTVVSVRKSGNRFLEVSRGDFLGKDLYGATVVEWINGRFQTRGGDSFRTRKEAEDYLRGR